jgi:hypothetical protein
MFGVVEHDLFVSLSNIRFHLDFAFQFLQEIILCLFQQNQVIRGQNQIINIQNYDHIRIFLNSLKNKHYG